MTYLIAHPGQVAWLLSEHITIVLGGLLASIVVALPLGILVDRVRRLEVPVMALTGLLYIVPSLALFAVLIPFTGLGKVSAVVAQVVYSLLVITRNTATGLRSVAPAIREAELGLGMSAAQKLWLVEFPLALPVVVGGIRIAAVMGVGIASIAAYIGAGGLGTLIFRGIATLDGDVILAGALPVTALALGIDALLRSIERRLSADPMDALSAFFADNRDLIAELGLQHIALTGSALLVATLLGVSCGIAAWRMPTFARAALGVANVAQAIPSIAVLGFVVPFLGVGFLPALVALALRGLLPIYLNTYLGLTSLPAPLREAGLGLGLRPFQALVLVDLPIASPVIMAGIRTAAVEGVAIATLAAFIGAGGLGDLILQGIAMMDPARLLGGALPAALLAVAAELLFAGLEKLLRTRFRA